MPSLTPFLCPRNHKAERHLLSKVVAAGWQASCERPHPWRASRLYFGRRGPGPCCSHYCALKIWVPLDPLREGRHHLRHSSRPREKFQYQNEFPTLRLLETVQKYLLSVTKFFDSQIKGRQVVSNGIWRCEKSTKA